MPVCHVLPGRDLTEVDLGAFVNFLPFLDPRVTSVSYLRRHGTAQVNDFEVCGFRMSDPSLDVLVSRVSVMSKINMPFR